MTRAVLTPVSPPLKSGDGLDVGSSTNLSQGGGLSVVEGGYEILHK
jgi:hypothetical protein